MTHHVSHYRLPKQLSLALWHFDSGKIGVPNQNLYHQTPPNMIKPVRQKPQILLGLLASTSQSCLVPTVSRPFSERKLLRLFFFLLSITCGHLSTYHPNEPSLERNPKCFFSICFCSFPSSVFRNFFLGCYVCGLDKFFCPSKYQKSI